MRRDALLRYRAERLMRKDFQALQPQVLAAVGARLKAVGASLDRADLDACYSAAWHSLYAALAEGAQIEDATAWLVLVTFRRAVDEYRALARQRAVGKAQATLALVTGSSAPTRSGDIADELDRRERIRQLMEGFVSRLSPRERRAATLCYLHGLSRAQAAWRMGVSQARMRKLMDGSPGRPGVAAKVSGLLQSVGASEWCEQQGSLMRAHALGLLDPEGERQELAREHLRHCPACRALVLALRGLAAVLPPLAGLTRTPVPGPAGSGRGRGSAGARATRAVSTARGGGSLVWKLAVAGVAGVAAIGSGGGYALLAGGSLGNARAHGHRPTQQALRALTAPGAGGPSRSQPAHRHPSSLPLNKQKTTSRPVRRPAPSHATPTHPSALAQLPSSLAPSAPSPSRSGPSPNGKHSPSSEFTPERVGGLQRGG